MKKINRCDFVDIHSHILYGVDDGSRDVEMSMDMLKIAYNEGIRNIVCTPHYHPGKCTIEFNEILERFTSFKEKVSFFYPDIEINLGRELFYSSDVVEALEDGKKLSMGDSKYVLVEYDPVSDYTRIRNSIGYIMQSGYIPIIAHIERYMCVVDDWQCVYELKDLGALIQMNSNSITDPPTRGIKKFVKRLLKSELVDFIGTDAHSNGRRSPRMLKCAEYLYKKFGAEYAKTILHDNAELVLRNADIK